MYLYLLLLIIIIKSEMFNNFKQNIAGKLLCREKLGGKNLVLIDVDMIVWMNGLHNPLAHTHFNAFVDEC